MDFGWALARLRDGGRVCRQGWNGKGMWIELQMPDEGSKMTLPYLFIEYPQGHRAYPHGCRVPWLASQTDLLAMDWQLVSGEQEVEEYWVVTRRRPVASSGMVLIESVEYLTTRLVPVAPCSASAWSGELGEALAFASRLEAAREAEINGASLIQPVPLSLLESARKSLAATKAQAR